MLTNLIVSFMMGEGRLLQSARCASARTDKATSPYTLIQDNDRKWQHGAKKGQEQRQNRRIGVYKGGRWVRRTAVADPRLR